MRTSPFAVLQTLFTISDEQAMWRVQTQEDSTAFAQLVKRWEGPIRALCSRMTGDTHRAEDLSQEVFARVFSKRSDYAPTAKFSTWVWRIALNLCYDEIRRLQRRPETSLDGLLEGDAADALPLNDQSARTPAQDAIHQERAELVRQALMRLSESYRSVVVLRHYEDLKFREIADVLGIPEGTVKSRMAEAMDQLADMLDPTIHETQPICTGSTNRPRNQLLNL